MHYGTLVVQKPSAASVARHYGVGVRSFQRWVKETPNASVIGSLDSPAMRSLVGSFKAKANFAGMARGLAWERVNGQQPVKGWRPEPAEPANA